MSNKKEINKDQYWIKVKSLKGDIRALKQKELFLWKEIKTKDKQIEELEDKRKAMFKFGNDCIKGLEQQNQKLKEGLKEVKKLLKGNIVTRFVIISWIDILFKKLKEERK